MRLTKHIVPGCMRAIAPELTGTAEMLGVIF